MIPVRDALTGKIALWHINAEHDSITCPGCRVCVPVGQVCRCKLRTKGPQVENETRKILIKEQRAER